MRIREAYDAAVDEYFELVEGTLFVTLVEH